MKELIDWIDANRAFIAVGVFYAFGVVADSLPEPLPLERWYGFLYKVAHALAANWSKTRNGK